MLLPPDLPTRSEVQEYGSDNNRLLDLDGMNVLTRLGYSSARLGMDLESAVASPEDDDTEDLPWGDELATATWAPMMAEVHIVTHSHSHSWREISKILGPNWRCPSPVILHIGNPEPLSSSTSSAIYPVWKKSNELFGKVFSYHSTTGTSSFISLGSDHAEAGVLYLGIKEGWDMMSNAWTQSPVLNILKQIDDLLFCHLPNMERLAVA
jgi:hypothetical protein